MPKDLPLKSSVKIGEAAKILGVSIDTLRRWEKKGKLEAIRTPGGTRLYNVKTLQKIIGVPVKSPSVKIKQATSIPTQELLNKTVQKGASPLQPVATEPVVWEDVFEELQEEKPSVLAVLRQNLPSLPSFHLPLPPLPKLPIPPKNLLYMGGISFAVACVATGLFLVAGQFLQHAPKSKKVAVLSQVVDKDGLREVLAASASAGILEINANVEIGGTLNGLTLIATSGSTLNVLSDVTLDQDVSTTSTPTFESIILSNAVNQIGGNTITFPSATTTLVGTDTKDTLTNKTMSGSSNTFTDIPNSALVNKKVTITAGTNLTGGGPVELGSSITIGLKSSPTISGQVLLADGTAAAPALSFTDDTDTGLYRIGTNNISLITGGTAGQGITIDASGNVGLNTITPTTKLHVVGTTNITGNTTIGGTLGVTGATTLSSTLAVNGNTTIGDASGDTITFNADAWTLANDTNVTLSGGLNGLSFDTTTLSIDAANDRVGIGTTSPNQALEVIGSGRISSTLQLADGTNTSPAYTFTNDTNTGLYRIDTDRMSFVTGGASRLSINSSGNVGIGTTDPATALEVVGAGTISDDLAVNGGDITTSATTFNLLNSTATTLNIGGAATSIIAGATNGAFDIRGNLGIGTSSPGARLSVAGGGLIGYTGTETAPSNGLAVFGNLGLGTTSPGYKLEVVGTSHVTGTSTFDSPVQLADGTVGSPSLTFTNDTDTGLFRFASDAISVVTGGANRVLINSAGNVGIGVTSPLTPLHVGGAITTNGNILAGLGGLDIGSSATRFSTIYAITVDATTIAGVLSSGSTNNNAWTINADAPNGDTEDSTLVFARGQGTPSPNAVLGWDSTNKEFDLNGGLHITDTITPTGSQTLLNLEYAGTGAAFRVNDDGTSADPTPFLIDANGNVGIGTSTPGATLQIAGNQVIGYGGAPTAGPTNGLAVFGNVGIGTTSPVYKLEVVGTSHFTGNSTFDGVLQLADGTNAAPSLTFLNDTNTGLYRIDTDRMSFVTGGASALTINSSGYVGIGTTNPLALLEIAKATSGNLIALDLFNSNAASSGVTTESVSLRGIFASTAGGKQVGGNITFGKESDYTTGANNDSFMAFYTATNNSDTEKLRITSTGNVGIGTSTPGSLLQIAGNAVIGFGGAPFAAPSQGLVVSGNVGVGTSSPTNKLSILGTADIFGGNLGIGTSTPGARLAVAGGGLIGYLGTEVAPTNGLAVLGNVGIGTTSPAYNLHVVGTTNITGASTFGAALQLADGTNSAPSLTFTNDTNTGLYRIDTDRMSFVTGGASRLTINTDGNVGIGTTSPSGLLHVGSSATTPPLLVTTGGTTFINDNANTDMTQGLTINQGTNDNTVLAFKSSDVAHGITAQQETDTFGWFRKYEATGGMIVAGYSSSSVGLLMAGAYTTDTTTKSTSSLGAVVLQGELKTGADLGAMGADANILAIRNNGSATRFIFDAEGDLWLSGDIDSLGGTEIAINETGADVDFRVESDTNIAAFFVDGGTGNVGIGNTSPGATLQVNGNGVIGYGSGTVAGPSNGLAVLGNVGIGTTSPAYNLQVVGTTNITGVSTFGGVLQLADGTNAAPSLTFTNDTNTGLYRIDTDRMSFVSGGASALTINSSGNVGIGITNPSGLLHVGSSATTPSLLVTAAGLSFVNDNANANMTQGLTINQGANDDNILDLKSSDVIQPFTGLSLAEADTYAAFRKIEAGGGLGVIGIKDSTGVAGRALLLDGYLGEAADTTKSTSAEGVVHVGATVTDGSTGRTSVGADGNLFVIRNLGAVSYSTRFIFDAEGELHLVPSSGPNTVISPSSTSSFMGGNVGLGTSSPGARLAVAGGGLFGYTGTEVAPTNGLAVFGNVGIGTTSPAYNLHVVGTANITGATTLGGNLTPSVDDTYDLGSNTLRWRDLYLGPGTMHIGTSTSDEYSLSYDTTNNRLGFNVNDSGNAEVVFDSNGNVGIGTTGPTGILHVAPIAATSGNGAPITLTAQQGAATSTGGAITLTTGAGGSTSGSSGALSLATGTAASTIDTGTITIQTGAATGAANTGSITIRSGTISVDATTKTTGAVTIQSGDSTGSLNGQAGAVTVRGGDSGYNPAGSLTLRAGDVTGAGGANNTAGATLSLAGGAGHGTQNGGLVSIVGGATAAPGGGSATGNGGAVTITGGQGVAGTGGAITLTTGAGGSTSGASGALTLASNTTTSGRTGDLTLRTGAATGGNAGDIFFQTNGANNRMTIAYGGNVGIGTSTPGATLQIAGNSVIGFGAAPAVTGPTNGLAIGGNVGIGTSNPTGMLHVGSSVANPSLFVPTSGNVAIRTTNAPAALTLGPIYLADTFNRSNSTNLGSTDTGSAAWTENSGDMQISSNQVVWVSGVGIATVESNSGDIDISATLARGGASSSGIVWRFADTSNYWYIVTATNLEVHRVISGSDTTVVTVGGGGLSNSTSGTFRVRHVGSDLRVFKNGVQQTAQTDSNLSTNTKHGIVAISGCDTSCTMDNVIISPLSTGIDAGLALSRLTPGIISSTGTPTYGQHLQVLNSPTAANNVYGQYISFVDEGTLTNRIYGLYVDTATTNTSDTQYAAAFMNGNVGIGTSTPGATLQIAGNSVIGFGAAPAITGPTNGLAVGGNIGIGNSNPLQRFHVNQSETTSFVVASSGNVGIGTSSPTAALSFGSTSTINTLSAGNLTLQTGAGTGSGAGGTLALTGGAGGATGAGGPITLTSGAGGGTSGNSGALTLTTGSVTSGTSGAITINPGAVGNAQTGGAVTITGGDVAPTTGGSGTTGSVTIRAGDVAKVANTNVSASGAVTITGGRGISNGTGGAVTIQGGPHWAYNGPNGGGGSLTLAGGDADTSAGQAGGAESDGGTVTLRGGTGWSGPDDDGTGAGGALSITGGTPGVIGAGGAITLATGPGGTTSGNSGDLTLRTGSITSGTAGNIYFQTNGTNLRMTVANGGNVGIGTSTPGATLQIAGNSVIGFGAAPAVTGPTNGLAVGGNVGIGNSNPAARLEITGNLLFTKEAARTISVADSTTSNTAGAALTIQGAAGAATNAAGGAINITAGASVGTGTGGAVAITGGSTASTSTSIAGAVTITGGTHTGTGAGDYTAGAVTIAGGSILSGTTSSKGGAVSITGGRSNGTATGGAITLTGGFGGDQSPVGGDGGAVTITGGVSLSGSAGVGGAASLIGGAGVGTSAGGAAILTGGAGGATGAGGAITLTTGAGGGTSGASGALTLATGTTTSGRSGDLTLRSGAATGGNAGDIFFQTNGTNLRMTVAYGGNVGIGTSTPGATLQIAGNSVIGFGVAPAVTAPSNGLAVGGNVGIGTSNPSKSLHVVGSERITGTIASEKLYDPLLDSLVYYLPFSEGTGSTAADRSVNGNDGTITGGTWTTSNLGNALSFNGTSDFVESNPDAFSVTNTTSWSMVAWINPSSITDTGTIMAVSTDGSNFVSFYKTSADLGWRTQKTGDTTRRQQTNSSIFAASNWYQVVLTKTGNNDVKAYVNGVEYTTRLTQAFDSPPNVSNRTWVGRIRTADTSLFFNGTIDEPMVFTRVLSLAEIRELYERGLGTQNPYVNNVNGYVGVNTTSPTSLFSVNGAVSIGTYAAGGPAAPSNGLIVSGNVGIGTSVPAQILHVQGTQYISGNLGIGTSSPGARLSVAGGGLIGYTGTQSLSSGADLAVFGNVGIGTTSPNYKLDVAGSLNVTGDVYKNGSAYTNPDYALEHWVTGGIVVNADKPGASTYTGILSLEDTEAFVKQNFQLPRVASATGIFERGDILLEKMEEAYIHLFDLNRKIASNSAQLSDLSTALTTQTINLGSFSIASNSAGLTISSAGQNLLALDALGNMKLAGTITSEAGAFDVAEDYPATDESIEAGDVVAISETVEGNIEKSSTPYQNGIIGVISTKPGVNMTGGENGRPVALAGRVPVKVTTESGPVKAGDYLTSSSIPGLAMKMTRAGTSIGKALESFSCPTEEICQKTVMTFINVSWHDPTVYFTAGGMQQLAPDATPTLANLSLDTELASQSAEASSSATLASQGEALQGVALSDDPLFKDLLTKIDLLSSKLDTLQKVVIGTESAELVPASSSAELLAAIEDVQLNASGSAILTGDLTVAGRTTLADVGITGSLNAGLLTINGLDSSINTLAGDLKLQNLGLGGIDILAGKIKIDTKGNIVSEGTVTAKEIEAEKVTTQKLVITEPETASSSAVLSASSSATLANTSIGNGAIPANATKVTIKTAAATKSARVFITPTSATDKPLAVVNIQDGESFDVVIPTPTPGEITFNWWLVETQ